MFAQQLDDLRHEADHRAHRGSHAHAVQEQGVQGMSPFPANGRLAQGGFTTGRLAEISVRYSPLGAALKLIVIHLHEDRGHGRMRG